MNFSPLIETQELAERIGQPGFRLLDATWHMPPTMRDAFAEFRTRHIPGAVFFDIDAISDTTSSLPHMLPSAEFFERQASALGIGNEDTVVVYDTHGLMSAARVWWMFRFFGHTRVMVLNGGLPKWQQEERPLESGLPMPAPSIFKAHPNPALRVDAATIQAHLPADASPDSRSSLQVLDVRSSGRFCAEEPEPRPGVRGGHIPGSFNIPWATLLHPGDKTLLSPDALRVRFEEAGLNADEAIACSCGSGITACIGLLALTVLGNEKSSVYDGSWAEWGSRNDLPVEV